MRWLLVTAVLMLAPLGAPAEVRAQTETVLQDGRLGSVRDQLRRAVRSARQEDLPAEWLLDKIAEGLSKRVPPARIAGAVDALLGRLRVADGLVRAVPGADGDRRRLLRAATDALAAGAPGEPLGLLVRQVAAGGRGAPQRVHEALTTVAELAERQFGGAAAVDATAEAYRRGRAAGMQELLGRARQIARDPPGGRDEALRGVGRGIGPGRTGVDRSGGSRDHGRDVHPGRGRR